MKISAILILAILTVNCVSSSQENAANYNANQPNYYDELFKKNSLEIIEKERKELREYLAKRSKKEKLSVLEKAEFKGNDLEIRVRKQSAWWKTWLFILRRIDYKWSAEYQKQVFYDGTQKLKNIFKKQLDEPKSRWEIFWQKLNDEQVLNLADGVENGGNDPCPDCGNYLIEIKTAEEFKIYIYTLPRLDSELYEARQIAKISNIISEEFELYEFNTETSVE